MENDQKEKMVERDPGGTSGQFNSNGGATEQAKQQGQQFASQARQQASELATRGGEQVKSQIANQKHDASQRMVPIQSALRETAQQLRKQGQGSTAGYADQAADRVESVSGYLRETDVDEMVGEVRGFARSRPAVFLSGAVALGFLASRFLKSSSQAQQGQDAGHDYDRVSGATSRSAVAYGGGAPAPVLPPSPVESNQASTANTRFTASERSLDTGYGRLDDAR